MNCRGLRNFSAGAAAESTDRGVVSASNTPDAKGGAALEALFQSWIDLGMAKSPVRLLIPATADIRPRSDLGPGVPPP